MLHQIICQPTAKNDKKLKKICEPLSLAFGLDTFWYYTLSDKGELCYISNNPRVAEFFYANNLYKGHPYFKDPKLLKSGFFFAEKTTAADYVQTQGKMRDLVTMDQIFMVMNIDGGKAEGYGFAATQPVPDMTNAIINNLYAFKRFINYFHYEAEGALKQMKENSVDIATECGESFYMPSQYFDEFTFGKDQEAFLKRIDPIQFEMLKSLSRREKECIKWLLKGLSAVQIGKKIHLSSRTVEFYIENVKNKLGCRTKQELFDVLLNCSDFLHLTFF